MQLLTFFRSQLWDFPRSAVGPEFEKGDGRLRPSLQQRLPGAEGPPEGCTTDPRHAACGGPLPSSAEGPCILFPFGAGSALTLLELPASGRSRHGRACEAPVPPVQPMLSPLPRSRLARHLASPQGSSLAPAASLCRSPAPAPPTSCTATRDAPPSLTACIRATPAVPLLPHGSHVTANAPAAAP